MAIDRAYLHYLEKVIHSASMEKPKKIACLSYPDIIVPTEYLLRKFPELVGLEIREREDSSAICRWHGIKPEIKIPDSASVFTALGYEIDFFDISQLRGNEIIVNFNNPLPEKYVENYDLVIDTGTLEHCFNVGEAFIGMCKLVRKGGILITQAPMTKINHGFWNFSPCVYENFFTQNNWKIKFIEAYLQVNNRLNIFAPEPNKRFQAPPETILVASAVKLQESKIEFPTQSKYLK